MDPPLSLSLSRSLAFYIDRLWVNLGYFCDNTNARDMQTRLTPQPFVLE